MFSRGLNEEVLRSEGHNVPKSMTDIERENAAPYKMKFWYNYVDPAHKNTVRPIVDVSAPFNVLDETHQARKFGVQKVAFNFLSLTITLRAGRSLATPSVTRALALPGPSPFAWA